MGEKGQDIYEVLIADHRAVTALLEELGAIPETSPAKRKALFAKIREELIRHAEAEEHVLYTILKQHEGLRDKAMEGVQEHHQIRVFLGEMDAMSADTETWTAKLKVLTEDLEHHIHEEEDEIFPKARTFLRGERAEEVAVEFKAEKAQIEV